MHNSKLPNLFFNLHLVCAEPCGMPNAHSAQTKLVQKCPINYMFHYKADTTVVSNTKQKSANITFLSLVQKF